MKRSKKPKSKFTFVASLLIIVVIGVIVLSTNLIKVSVNSDTLDADSVPDNFTDSTVSAQKISVDAIRNSENKNVILFSSSWCGSCDKLKQDLSTIAGEYPEMNVYIFDLEADREAANSLSVPVAPTLVLLDAGKTKNYSEVSIDNIATIINDFDRIGIR